MNAVVMLLSNTTGSIGGTQRQADLLAIELAERGLDVVLVSKARPALPAGVPGPARPVQTLELPVLRWLPGWSLLVSFLVWAAVHRRRIAVFHAHSTSAGVIAGLAGWLLGKPVVVKVTGMHYARGLAGRSGGRRLRRWTLARTAGAIVALSPEMREALAAAGLGDRVALIPNGVALAARADDRQRAARRAQWLGGAATSVVLYVGRLTPSKRVDALLAAWRLLDRAGALLLIVGDGPARAALEIEAQGLTSVRFLGMRDDVTPFYQMADVFALPSATEGMSNSLLEAMAAGLPVVAADIAANRELVEDGASGFLVDWTDTAACAGLLARLLDDAPLRGRAGDAARSQAARFSIGSVANRYCALYASLGGALGNETARQPGPA